MDPETWSEVNDWDEYQQQVTFDPYAVEQQYHEKLEQQVEDEVLTRLEEYRIEALDLEAENARLKKKNKILKERMKQYMDEVETTMETLETKIADKPKELGAVGYKFWKLFDEGWFEGEVCRVLKPEDAEGDKDRYCCYTDGDKEDLSITEIKELKKVRDNVLRKVYGT